MSSTGRGTERAAGDTYFTRFPLALAICERLASDQVVTGVKNILEPSAGAGAFVAAAAEVWCAHAGFSTIFRVDLDASLILPEHEARAKELLGHGELLSVEGDFLKLRPDRVRWDLIVGNPPFLDAEAHIRHALTLLAPGGKLAFLLRLNFLSSMERSRGLWADHPPEYVYVLDKRPSFTSDGKTDSVEYAVVVWAKERPEFEPVIRWLRWSEYLKKFRNTVERIPLTSGQEVDEARVAGYGSPP